MAYIEYEYLFEFTEPKLEDIDYDSLSELNKSVSNQPLENPLNTLLYDQRLSIKMRSGDPNYNPYRAMFVTVLAVANSDTIQKLKDFNTFYTHIEDEDSFCSVRESSERKLLNPNRLSFGENNIKFLDKNKKLIINVSCHEKNYIIGENFLNYFIQI